MNCVEEGRGMFELRLFELRLFKPLRLGVLYNFFYFYLDLGFLLEIRVWGVNCVSLLRLFVFVLWLRNVYQNFGVTRASEA